MIDSANSFSHWNRVLLDFLLHLNKINNWYTYLQNEWYTKCQTITNITNIHKKVIVIQYLEHLLTGMVVRLHVQTTVSPVCTQYNTLIHTY